MTEGISKEELIGINPWEYCTHRDLLEAIIKRCVELDPWLKIDDNTPRDREILLYDNGIHIGIFDYFDGILPACWVDRNGRKLLPTLYKLLPGDQK